MNVSSESTKKTGQMMGKVGLEAGQGFATRSLQFSIFLMVIIQLFTTEASTMFSHNRKSFRSLDMRQPTIPPEESSASSQKA
jgi:hypothetical protein